MGLLIVFATANYGTTIGKVDFGNFVKVKIKVL